MNNNTIEKEIIRLRLKGMGMKSIADQLNITKGKVKYYCKKNNLVGVRSSNVNALEGTPFERFIFGFNKHHADGFEYVSGFENSEKPVLVRCKSCGHEFTRSAQCARKSKKLTCSNCVKGRQEVLDMKASVQRDLNEQVKLLIARVNEHVERVGREINSAVKEYNCAECNSLFHSQKKKIYCSDKCRNHKRNRIKELHRRTKLKENGHVDYSITLEKLMQRDKDTCKLCGEEVNTDDYINTDEGYHIAGESYPSIDHVLPVSKGGTHTWDNVQLAHRGCNTNKRDNDLYEQEGQLALSI